MEQATVHDTEQNAEPETSIIMLPIGGSHCATAVQRCRLLSTQLLSAQLLSAQLLGASAVQHCRLLSEQVHAISE